MKQILLLLSVLLFTLNLSAQNYDSYLQKAYSALEEGKIEVAQSSYNIYKKMTKKTDLDFEILIKDKIENDWKNSCHIIKVSDTVSLAVQHIDEHQIPVSYHMAKVKAQASRLGNFADWRLPQKSELYLILPNISSPEKELLYWMRENTYEIIKTYSSGRKERIYLVGYHAMSNISYILTETYYAKKIDNIITETRGNRDNPNAYFLVVRTFNPNKE